MPGASLNADLMSSEAKRKNTSLLYAVNNSKVIENSLREVYLLIYPIRRYLIGHLLLTEICGAKSSPRALSS